MEKRYIAIVLFIIPTLLASCCLSVNSSDRSFIVLGDSKIELHPNDTVGVQIDRVVRDIHWDSPVFGINVPANRTPAVSEIVPYMEGARTKEMMDWAKIEVMPLTPARAQPIWSAKQEETLYYAMDGQGNYSFQIDPSKMDYRTVKWPISNSENVVLPDTHGFNMIAEQGYLHRNELYLAVACMDLPDKTNAAKYLAANGINIYAPCDRFASDLMDYKQRFDVETTIIGSAPIRATEYGAVIGSQPITIYLDEPIVVQFTDKGYPDQYCDTPWRYFTALNNTYEFGLQLIKVEANAGEAKIVIDAATENNVCVVGIRIWNEEDYKALSAWLSENKTRRAVLLHSAAYEPGIRIFREFSEQTTFGDLTPQIFRIG